MSTSLTSPRTYTRPSNMPRTHHSAISDDDISAPSRSYSTYQARLSTHHNFSSTSVNSQSTFLSISSGVQSQIGARWRGDLSTTTNSGFGDQGPPRSMGRKPVREGRERAVGQQPLPETIRRALGLMSVAEEEEEVRRMRKLEEQALDYRHMLRRIQKQQNPLEESQKKLDSDVRRFISRGDLEPSFEQNNDLKALRTGIQELKEDLDNYEVTVRISKRQAATQGLYEEQFTALMANIKTMRGLASSTTKRLIRYMEVMQEMTPKQKTSKMLSAENRGEQAETTFLLDLKLPETTPVQQESFASHAEIPNTVHRDECNISPAEQPSDNSGLYQNKTALEGRLRGKITGLAEESNSLMTQLVHLMPAVVAHMSTPKEPTNSCHRAAVRARLLAIQSRSNDLRNKLIMGFPELEAESLTVEDLATVAPNIEAICRAVGGLLPALAPKSGLVTTKNQPPKCKEPGGPGADHHSCASEEETDDDESYATLVEDEFLCEKPTNEACPSSPSGSSITLVDSSMEEDCSEPISSTKPALRPLRLVDIVMETGTRSAVTINPSIQSLFIQSIQYHALQRALVPDVAVLEHCRGSWSFARVMQVKGLAQTLRELLQDVTELQCGLKEAENYEDEDEDGGELMATIKRHSQMAREMKSEVSAMIRSVLYCEHCQKNLKSQENKTAETPRTSMRAWLDAREEARPVTVMTADVS